MQKVLIQNCRKIYKCRYSILLYLFLFVFRVLNAFLVKTWYVADEYWQALEPAHLKIFGYGYLTWEWDLGLRSSLLPYIIMVIYKILFIFGWDTKWGIVFFPKLSMALLGFICDILYFKWANNIDRSNINLGKWILFAYISNWFAFYCIPRTLSNTIEMYYNIIIIYLYPWELHKADTSNNSSDNKFLKSALENVPYMFFIFNAIYFRPTAFPLCILILFHFIKCTCKIRFIILLFLSFCFCFLLNIYVDSFFYGKYVITPLNFIKFNYFYNISHFYGSQPWYWYILIGIPAVLGIHTLGLLVEFWNTKFIISFILLLSIAMLSIFPHKEFRFLLPLVPFFSYISGMFYNHLHDGIYNWVKYLLPYNWVILKNVFIALIIFIHINFALYFSIIHQRGTIDIMSHINKLYETDPNISILFLMPCHSTPYYSHIHQNITMKFLTCNPYLPGTSFNTTSENEYEILQVYPKVILQNLLENNLNGNHTFSHIFLYSNIYNLVEPIITSFNKNYSLCRGFFHTHIPYDNIGPYILCFCKNFTFENNIPQ